MKDEAEFDTGEEVTLEEADQPTQITPELIQAAMAGGYAPGKIRTKRGITKPVFSKDKRKKANKAQRRARKATRGTTSSRKGQKFRINHSAAK